MSPDNRKMLDAYKNKLIYNSNRVPRKFVSLIRQNLKYDDSSNAFLNLEDSIEDLTIFTELVKTIDDIYDEETTDLDDEAIKDYYVSQLFLLAKLVMGKDEDFDRNEILKVWLDNMKKEVDKETRTKMLIEITQSQLEDYLDSFLGKLENKSIIEKFDSPPLNPKYRIKKETALKLKFDKPVTLESNYKRNFNDFISISKKVYSSLYKSLNRGQEKNLSYLSKLVSADIIPESFLDFIDESDKYYQNEQLTLEAINFLMRKKIRLTPIKNKILEFYFNEIFSSSFKDHHYEIGNIGSDKIVFGKEFNNTLMIELKFRRRISRVINTTLLEIRNKLAHNYRESERPVSYLLVFVSPDSPETLEKAKQKYEKTIDQSFIEYKNRIHFIFISVSNLENLKIEVDKVKNLILSIDIKRFEQKPTKILQNDNISIPSKFINWDACSISVWTNLPDRKEILNKRINNRYILSHATNDGGHIALNPAKYENALGLSLSPDVDYSFTNENQKNIYWQFWISNKDGREKKLRSNLIVNSGWYHILVRWMKNDKMQLVINGEMQNEMSDYENFWPSSILDKVLLGNWINIKMDKLHYEYPIYRLKIEPKYVDETWISVELANKPKLE